MILTFLTVAPSFLIIIYLINSDRFPEPTDKIIKVVLWGIAIILPAAVCNEILINNWTALGIDISISHSFLSAAPIEEGLKFLILTTVIAKYKDYNEMVDGIVYCVCLSQGFAVLENIYYVYLLHGSSFEVAILRAFSAVPAHAMFGAIMGIFYSQYLLAKKKKDKNQFFILSILIPILLHGFYNYFMYTTPILAFFLLITGIYFCYNVFKKWNGKKSFKI